MYQTPQDRGLFLLRVALALVFIAHGWAKVSDFSVFLDAAESLHIPTFFAYLLPLIEILGGIAVLLGSGVRFVGCLFAIIMIFAIALVKKQSGYMCGYELEVLLFLLSLALVVGGSGQITLANAAQNRVKKT